MENISITLIETIVPDVGARAALEAVETEFVDEEVLEVFYEYMTECSENLQTALNASDTDKVLREAHSLKGTGSAMGFPELSIVGAELEIMAQQGAHSCRPLIDLITKWTDMFVPQG